MRIPLHENDIKILKKASNIIRKEFKKENINLSHTKVLDELARSLGYIDFKQLSRLSTKSQIINVFQDVTKTQVLNWLKSHIGKNAESLFEKLNFKSLNLSNNSFEKNKIIVFDEFSKYSSSLSGKFDKEIYFLESLGIQCNKWKTLFPSDDIETRNILLSDRLLEAVSNLPEMDYSHQEIEINKSNIIKKLENDTIPSSLVSISWILKNEPETFLSISPLGFRIIQCTGIDNSSVGYALYNSSLRAVVEDYFDTYEDAQLAKAKMISFCKHVKPENKSNSTLECNLATSLASVKNGKFETSHGNEPAWIDFAFGRLLFLSSINEFGFLYVLDIMKEVTDNDYFFEHIDASYESSQFPFPWLLTLNTRESIGKAKKTLEEVKTLSSRLDSDKKLSSLSRTINYIKENISMSKYDPDCDLYVDNEDYIKSNFPRLLEHFSIIDIDAIHEEVAGEMGFRTRGDVYVSETELITYLFCELAFDEYHSVFEYRHEKFSKFAAFLFENNYELSKVILTIQELGRMEKDFNREYGFLTGAKDYVNRNSSSHEMFKGDEVKTFLGLFRSGRKYSVKASQSLEDFNLQNK